MPRSADSWHAEIAAHRPQGRDRMALARSFPDLSSWRVQLCEEPEHEECLELQEPMFQWGPRLRRHRWTWS